ncbi:MAG: DUF1700 domain-containing protein [Lachnospiraceae bacterium]
MSKQEFMKLLTESLDGRVPRRVVREKADYYRNYIAGEERKGRSADEILEEIGPPELIAHTIIDAYEAVNGVYEESPEAAAEQERESAYESYEESSSFYSRNSGQDSRSGSGSGFVFNSGSTGCLIALILVVVLVVFVISTVARIFAAYPVLIAILVIWYMVRKNRRGRW